MQLSKKPKTFWQFFIAFFESMLIFEQLESHSLSISEVTESKRRG